MKYTVLGFQQSKLLEYGLNATDALILRVIKDMYSTASMDFITEGDGVRYMWINYTYLSEQIPIVGSKRDLMRRVERYGKELLLLRVLKHERKGKKGNFSYVAPTAKLDGLQDFDLMTKSHNPYDEIAQPLCDSVTTLMTKSHNKDSSITDSSITDSSKKDSKDFKNILSPVGDSDHDKAGELLNYWNSLAPHKHPKLTEAIKKAVAKLKTKAAVDDFKDAVRNYAEVYTSKHFYKHVWTMDKFITQRNGYPDFLADGQRWIAYKADKSCRTVSDEIRDSLDGGAMARFLADDSDAEPAWPDFNIVCDDD